jgi:hypothetical protein
MFTNWKEPECVVLSCIVGIFAIVFGYGGLYILIYALINKYDKYVKEWHETEKNAEKQGKGTRN